MKKILIINGHPDPASYNHALADAYYQGLAKTGAEIMRINIAELQFNPNLEFGYRMRTELEPDLLDAIAKMKAADHLVWVFPMWWYGYPAVMKGFIDRTFLPGITYQPIAGSPFPKKLLKGKTARIIVTSDTPRWYEWLFMKSPALNQLKKGTFEFCGISPVKVTYLAVVKDSSEATRQQWLGQVSRLGEQGI